MNRHIEFVVVLKNHSDDFLVGLPPPPSSWRGSRAVASPCWGRLVGADGHTDQTTELSDAVIDVDEVVADFHFLQLLHRQRHFSCPRLLAFEVVLVESVENLVVGEETRLQIVVDETIVERFIDSDESSVLVPRTSFLGLHDLLQPLMLLLTVRQNIEPIALLLIVGDGLAKQVDILVEKGLRRGAETNRRANIRRFRTLGNRHCDVAEAFFSRFQLLERHHLLLVVELGDAVAYVAEIAGHKHRVVGQKVGKWHFCALHFRKIGYNFCRLTAFFRELVLHLESTNRINLVTEKIDAERQFTRKRINVENRATNGKLSRLIDVIDLLETQFAQLMFQFHNVSILPRFEFHDALVHRVLRHDQLGQCLGIGDDEKGWLTIAFILHPYSFIQLKPCDDLRAQNFVGGIALSVFRGTTIRRREKQHVGARSLLFHEHLRQVVKKIACLVVIRQNEKHRLPALFFSRFFSD